MTANQTIKERIYLFCKNQNISIITNSNVIEGSPGAKITSNEKDREIEYLRTMLAEKDARISELKLLSTG